MEKGSVLEIAVGQKTAYIAGGSGGTFVVKNTGDELIPLVIAGGAGADHTSNRQPWCHAQLEEYGNGNGPLNKNTNVGLSGAGEYDGTGFDVDQPNFGEDRPRCFKHGMMGGKLSGQKYNFLKYRIRV